MLDDLGIDYVEGGYHGANPTDTEFFAAKPKLGHASFTAFGMTRRPGRSASNDPGLAALLEAKADAICFVAKSSAYQVRVALETTNEENLASIRDSVKAAKAAVRAGAGQVQGTLNGLGERCGNGNLCSLIPTLRLKREFSDCFEIGVSPDKMATLMKVSRTLDDMLNRAPDRHAPYVGESAFVTKTGIHASAVLKDPQTYEHVPPDSVGNHRKVLVSDQAGRSNVIAELERAGIPYDKNDAKLVRLVEELKERDAAGYAYESANASFDLLTPRTLRRGPATFPGEHT